jgi:flagellar protein FlgJ
VTVPPAAAAMPGASSKDSPAKIHDAAQQFESLLIGQLLKTSREAGGGGWLGTDDDDAGATGMEIAEQQFAKMLASNGGLGLSRTIEAGLRARST